jgi:hypothetical protein
MIKVILSLIAACCVLLAIVELSNESTRLLITQSQGVRESGSAFGVTIGATRSSAVTTLRSQFTYRRTKRGGECLVRQFSAEYDLDIFHDRSWRKGAICVASRDGQVTTIVWSFNPFAP